MMSMSGPGCARVAAQLPSFGCEKAADLDLAAAQRLAARLRLGHRFCVRPVGRLDDNLLLAAARQAYPEIECQHDCANVVGACKTRCPCDLFGRSVQQLRSAFASRRPIAKASGLNDGRRPPESG